MNQRASLSATTTLALLLCAGMARAQTAPEIGYMHPCGGRAGSTVNVILGGYDWTPDMQLFVLDPRIKLELIGSPSPVLVPDPPYWFGAKGRGPAWPLPREFPARLTIPADVPTGLVRWQVANANGASPVGLFHIGEAPEIVEDSKRISPQVLPPLPVTVSGQIRKIEEIDRYEFTVPATGLVTIELLARQLGSPLHAMLQVQDEQRNVVIDACDSEGQDLRETFLARANVKYTLSLHDLDFAGDRSYVYRLTLRQGPQVKAAYPAAGRRGETRRFEFVGIGVATGAPELESVAREVTFPTAIDAIAHSYRFETPAGIATHALLVSDLPELIRATDPHADEPLTIPGAVTASFNTQFGSNNYIAALHKDEKWRFAAEARPFGSPLDLDLSVLGPDGKEVAANDDAPGTTDAIVALTAPADGTYRIVVTDRSGKSGTRAACYRLSVEPLREDFALNVPDLLSLPIGGSTKLTVTLTRTGGFTGPIQLAMTDVPEGVTVPSELVVPADKNDLAVEIQCASSAPATASLCTVSATAKLNDQPVTRRIGSLLMATVMKPRCKVTPEGLDDVRKVHRGSTYLAPLLVERLEGFQGDVTLEMTSKQQRHRQGLASDELVVAPGVTRVEYPIFVPEWMETTKTSRMILNGVVKVPDSRGNVRTLVNKMEMRIGILPEGALLKLSHTAVPPTTPGSELQIPLTISRATELHDPIRLEFIASDNQVGLLAAEPIMVSENQSEATFAVRLSTDPRLQLQDEQSLLIRATALKDGRWPVISETTVMVPIRSNR
jgi:hypothetical protein